MFYGWYIVGAGFLISFYVSGSINLGFTAVIEPIASEMGWSYTQISFATSLRGLETGILAPLAGIFLDRWGPRPVVLFEAIINGFGLLVLSQVSSLAMFYMAFVLIAAGMSTATTGLLMAAVANWFRIRAGLAMGVAASGVALGGLLIPLITILIDSFGWRQAMMIIGLGMWIIPMPLALLLRHKPQQYGYRPDGVEDKPVFTEAQHRAERNRKINISTRAVLTSRPFWIISTAFLCHIMALSAVLTHIMPYLGSIGIERSAASVIASVLPLLTIIGRIGLGWFGDRVDKRGVAALSFALTALGVLLLAFAAADRTWVLAVFILVFGIGWGGAVPMVSSLLRAYFGLSRLGTIVGFAGSVMMLGAIIGAPLAGWVFDTWGHYQPAWYLIAGVVAMPTFLFYAGLEKSQE